MPNEYNLEINFIQNVKSRAEELLFLLQFIKTLCEVGQDDFEEIIPEDSDDEAETFNGKPTSYAN